MDAIPLNLFKEEQGKIADGIAAIDRQFAEWRNRRSYFFGDGFSKRLLVGEEGLEPSRPEASRF